MQYDDDEASDGYEQGSVEGDEEEELGQYQHNHYFMRDEPPETILEVNSIEYTDGTVSVGPSKDDLNARVSPYQKENQNYIYMFR